MSMQELAQAWVAARDARDLAATTMQEIEGYLLLELAPGDTVPGYLKVVAPSKTFDPLLAALELPPDKLAQIMDQVVSLEKAKRYLTKEELARCYREGKGRPRIRSGS